MGKRPVTILLIGAIILLIAGRFFTTVRPDCPSVPYHLLVLYCPATATAGIFQPLQALAGLLMLIATLGIAWRLPGQRQWGWLAAVLLLQFVGIICWLLIGPDANER